MNQMEPNGANAETEVRFSETVRLWEVIFLVALSISLLIAAVWQSHKEYFGNDELITTILVSNPSFSEMWNAIRRGGELNPPLLFVTEWLVARIFGSGELAMRAIGGLSVMLAAWLLYFTVRPMTGRVVAAAAIAMVMGLSRDVFYYAHEARYYGLLFALVTAGLYLFVRLSADRPLVRRDYILVFLVHLALVYLHLYGVLYSGVLFALMAVVDLIVRRRLRWRLLGAVVAAWVCFGAWIPAMVQQLKSVSKGVYEPDNLRALGFFLEEIELGIPFALVLLFIAVLGFLAMLTTHPRRAVGEAASIFAPVGWAALLIGALGLMSVPVCTWAASLVLRPAPYTHRYIFPCTAAWAVIVALALTATMRLAIGKPLFKYRLSPWIWVVAWMGMVIFCLGYQPLRAKKNPPRPAVPFEDPDFGYSDLPIVFENSWYFIQRVVYAKGRRYMLVIDKDAGDADPFWYTANMERFFRHWYPRYWNAEIAYYKDLPDTAEGFIAVDDDYTKTFDWLFAHHPDLKPRLLGTRKSPHTLYGEERIWHVQKTVATEATP
jgi:hypothetical protein